MKKVELDFYKSDKKPDKVKSVNFRKKPSHIGNIGTSRNSNFENVNIRNIDSTIHSQKTLRNSTIHKKKKRFITRRKLFLFVPLIILCVIGYVGYRIVSPAGNAVDLSPIGVLGNALTGKKSELISTNGRVTVLILGVDNREDTLTQDLKQVGNTDSMMLISYDKSNNNVEFLSIPRDIGLQFKFPKGLTNNYYKINAAVNVGANQNYPGGGAELVRNTLQDMTGLTINYTVIIDFAAFVKGIDAVGGVDITVENTFCDAGYPLAGDTGVETIKFVKGPVHMDGQTALKFARSRVHELCSNMTAGDPVFEGTDFRRAYRQQQVIKALQDKIQKTGFDIGTFTDLIASFGNNMLTEIGSGPLTSNNKINLETLNDLKDLKDKVSKDKEYSLVTSQTACGGNAIKESNTSDGYYLLPLKNNDFTALRACVGFYLTNPEVISANAKITLYNTGLGSSKSIALSKEINTSYFINTLYGGSLSVPVSTTTNVTNLSKGIYIYTLNPAKQAVADFLAQKYNATVLTKENLNANFQKLTDTDIEIFAGV